MDYKAFLSPKEPVVLPYFGGTRVDAADRRYRLETELAPGWWRFKIDGRHVVPVEPAPPIDLGALPAVRGHWADGWIVTSGRELDRIALPPDDEPEALSRVVGRRWFSGDLLFDTTEFEDEAEVAARRALEERRSLADIAGVVPSLRAAFGYTLGLAVAREAQAEVSLRELTPRVVEIADGGATVARALIDRLVAERRRAAEEARIRAARVVERARQEAEVARLLAQENAMAERAARAAIGARAVTRSRDAMQRADAALDAARARMLTCRRVERGTQLDVTYEVDGTRIISLVDAESLQVLDPGICLSGAHRVLTLDAMPSVVREAIEEHHLNITRRA